MEASAAPSSGNSRQTDSGNCDRLICCSFAIWDASRPKRRAHSLWEGGRVDDRTSVLTALQRLQALERLRSTCIAFAAEEGDPRIKTALLKCAARVEPHLAKQTKLAKG